MEEYAIIRKIGNGAQGTVYEVEHEPTRVRYAMKMMFCVGEEKVNAALKEIKVLLQLRYPSIVSYVDFFLFFNNEKQRGEFAKQSELMMERAGCRSQLYTEKQDSLFRSHQWRADTDTGESGRQKTCASMEQAEEAGRRIAPTVRSSQEARLAVGETVGGKEMAVCLVMEYCQNGDMHELIREKQQRFMDVGSQDITEAQALSWLDQGAAALYFMHEKGFIHRDLKPTNIFFDEYRDIKIGDFGLAATLGVGRNSAVGTPYYLAPERMLQQRYDGKVDVWGLGMVWLELLTLRQQPINSMVLDNPKAVDAIVSDITRMGFSSKLAFLIRDMLQRQPQDRPTPGFILHRLANMTATAPHLGMSASLFAGMSCPKIHDALCDVCEVETAVLMCCSCKAAFCVGCDKVRHKHHSRQNHDRPSLASFVSSLNGASLTASTSPQNQQQLTLSSSSRSALPPNTSEQSRKSMHEASLSPSGYRDPSRTLARDRDMPGRTFLGLQPSLHGVSMSASEASLSHGRHTRTDCSGSNGSSTETVLRVPGDVESLAKALQLVESMPHVRQILVATNTTHTVPLVLTSRLPEGLKLVGESPPPMLEVVDSPFALRCKSGKGTIENFIVRHVGGYRPKLCEADGNGLQPVADKEGVSRATAKKPPRPTAISITGGEWRLLKCRISCVEGSGVTVGGSKRASSSFPNLRRTSLSSAASGTSGAAQSQEPLPGVEGCEDHGSLESAEEGGILEPTIKKCTFIDVTAAGVVLMERCRGLFEENTFSGCGFAAFLLKKEASPRIRSNHITDGAEAGIFCQDALGVIEYNVIAGNTGCGIVVKGAAAAPVIRKNRVLSNMQAGIFCCEKAGPFVSDNEIGQNGKAGVLVKTGAAPKVTRNIIERGKEAGIYVFEKGGGIIEENYIRGNQNAGVLVTTGGNPHVIHNTLNNNAYEGVWVCKKGCGTFCDNDLRGNAKGAKDIDADSFVTWVGNVEQ